MGCIQWQRARFVAVLLGLQVIFLVVFALFGKYYYTADARTEKHSKDVKKGGADPSKNELQTYYSMFQDVHVMIFMGFGFLMTFLKRYGYGAVGISFLVASFTVQWATIMKGVMHLHDGKIEINILSLLFADFSVATVLITFGAMLGKLSPLQLLVMSLLEISIFEVNEYIGLSHLKAVDVGGSMFVHVFGAYFGMTVARVMWRSDIEESTKEGPVYHSDIFSIIGTMFLWMFWPSFNSILAPGDDQHRAVINTYYSLAASCTMAFAFSALVTKKHKFSMEHIQNATMAGGVAVGTMADMMIEPWGAMLVGCVSGAISILGYRFITPFLNHKLKIHDTCGVHNLHGMPGLIAAFGGSLCAFLANTDNYGLSLYQVFPARTPLSNTTELNEILTELTVEPGLGRSASEQALYQMAALGVTMAFAIVGGIVTGLVLLIPIWGRPEGEELFEDGEYWELPTEDEEESEEGKRKADFYVNRSAADSEMTKV